MSDERFRRLPHPYNSDGPGSGRPSKRSRDPMSMARLHNATGSSAGPSLILPTRGHHYNGNNSNMGSRPSLPPPTRSSSSAQTVIDLTDSPPPQQGSFHPTNHTSSRAPSGPPRGGSSGRAEVIDVDALPDPITPPPRRGYLGWPQPLANPELLFDRPVASRLLGASLQASRGQPNHHHQHSHWASRPRPMPVEPSALYNRIPDRSGGGAPQYQPRYYQELEDPILGHGGRVGQVMPELHGMGGPRGMPYGGAGGGGGGGGAYAFAEGMMQQLIQSFPPAGQWRDEFLNFQAPNLDYRQRAPGIIREDSPVVDAARARNIDYKAPLPAKPGFTRSPKENDILVCANCSSELGVEVEGDEPLANEVWAAKCGHCYCGTCVNIFRSVPPARSASAKKPTRPKPKNCVVGCKMNLAARTSMFKIHL